jgi:exopolysaccharide biosynthesis polyprenyl glycosylphosphotransferase
MDSIVKLKQYLLFIGDIFVFYLSLILTLLLRYHDLESFPLHFWPFTVVFALWISILYITGLYDFPSLKNDPAFQRKLGWAFAVNIFIAVIFFYLITEVDIAPKTNLFLFILLSGLLGYGWRSLYNNRINKAAPTSQLLIIGTSPIAERLITEINRNPQIGYRVAFWIKGGFQDPEFRHLSQIILGNSITTIIVPASIKKSPEAARLIYNNLVLGIEVIDLAEIYERIFKKVPLHELEEVWFLDNLAKSHRIYETIKRPAEFFLALVFLIAALPLFGLVALFIALTSPGPIIFSQTRVGKQGEQFKIYKFRTMSLDAEKNGPQWAAEKDTRVTPFGRFLRRSHLDEVPQLMNVVRGELSIIGPRPERPEFVEQLRAGIPYYDLRHLVKPGITGWAQVNYRYGASVEDAYEKLQYEVYYLKNRSLVLDFLIVLKTLKFFFSNLA